MVVTKYSDRHILSDSFTHPYCLYEVDGGSIEFDKSGRVLLREGDEIVKEASGDAYKMVSWVEDTTPHHVFTIRKNIIFINWAQHYWHFHGETVAKMIMYEYFDVFNRYSPENTVILTDDDSGAFRGILRFLFPTIGLEAYEFITMRRGDRYNSSGVCISTTNMVLAGTVPPLWMYKEVNRKAGCVAIKKTERCILLSRNDASYRNLLNEDEVVSSLYNKFGVEVYEFSKTPYLDQVRLMGSSRLVIQISGTHGINNMYADASHTKVLVLSPKRQTGMGVGILEELGVTNRVVLSSYEEKTYTSDGKARNEAHNNFKVDVEEVLQKSELLMSM